MTQTPRLTKEQAKAALTAAQAAFREAKDKEVEATEARKRAWQRLQRASDDFAKAT